jgi:hypothetical protein
VGMEELHAGCLMKGRQRDVCVAGKPGKAEFRGWYTRHWQGRYVVCVGGVGSRAEREASEGRKRSGGDESRQRIGLACLPLGPAALHTVAGHEASLSYKRA